MKKLLESDARVLLIGEPRLITSAALCLLNAGHFVIVTTKDKVEFRQEFKSLSLAQNRVLNYDERLIVSSSVDGFVDCKLVIIISNEIHADKISQLKNILPYISSDTIVAINIETISIDSLCESFENPERLIGLNWTEPAHTTLFLEIIESDVNDVAVHKILDIASKHWAKDPYIVKEEGIRSRLISAMAREAVYLVDNGYASIADIDRACRNDAGYYLPFCGNCRYMDLMGAYAYGKVMKDLNPDLSKETEISGLLETIGKEKRMGMINNKGFYDYSDDEVKQWKETMGKFSYQIQSIIEKHPSNLDDETFID